MLALTLLVAGGLLIYAVISGNAAAVFAYFFPSYLSGRTSGSGAATSPVQPPFDPSTGWSTG